MISFEFSWISFEEELYKDCINSYQIKKNNWDCLNNVMKKEI